MAVEVRLADADDAEDIAVVHIAAWQTGYQGLMPAEYLATLDVAERAAGWRRGLTRNRDQDPVIVATVAGKLAGFAVFGHPQDEDRNNEGSPPPSSNEGELYSLNVHPEYWRSGVGTALLHRAHAGLLNLGFTTAILWVLPANERARRFYESRGWRHDDTERTADIFGITIPEVRYRRSF